MSRGTIGTRLPNGQVVVKGDSRQPSKMPCLKCHNAAHLIHREDGRRVYRWTGCGREWTGSKF